MDGIFEQILSQNFHELSVDVCLVSEERLGEWLEHVHEAIPDQRVSTQGFLGFQVQGGYRRRALAFESFANIPFTEAVTLIQQELGCQKDRIWLVEITTRSKTFLCRIFRSRTHYV